MAKKKAAAKKGAKKGAEKAPAKDSIAEKAKNMTCFVVIGFGMKTDYSTGRVLNLDKTYTELIKPAFDEVGVNVFRAIDVNRSGSIDEIMYQWLYKADLVIADLSTLNANVFYELGVRHAQKPNTTIVISESEVLKKIPFDLGHTVIHAYEHLGESISDKEKKRFVKHLADLVRSIIENPIERDSPVYTYMRGMKPPEYVDLEKRIAEMEAEEKKAAAADPDAVKKESLAMIIDAAEAAKNSKDFPTAIAMFTTAVKQSPTDIFLRQRLALVTYKNKDQDPDDEVAIQAMREAEKILDYCKPDISTDPETLGLAGAINKRLYDRTGEIQFLEKSIRYYERGFYVKQDYYNGINVAYMYTLKALQEKEPYEAIVNYGHANLIRKKVAEICQAIIDDPKFSERGDQEWVYQTLAQAYLGMDREDDCEALMPEIELLSKGSFDMSTFKEQNKKLVDAMEPFKATVPMPGDGGAAAPPPPAAGGEPAAPPPSDGGVAGPPAVAAPAGSALSQVRSQVVHPLDHEPITIDIGPAHGRKIKSIDVSCKIEYGTS